MPSAAMSESLYATATSCPAWAARKLVMKSLPSGSSNFVDSPVSRLS